MKTTSTKLKTLCLLLLVFCCATDAPRARQKTADAAALFDRIERALREKEPAWKFERSSAETSSDPAKQSIAMRSEEGQAAVEVWVWRRERDARDVFRDHSTAFDNGPGRRMVKASVAGLGDENHVWTNRGTDAWPTIKVRKGAAHITVFAPTLAVAKRFARRVLEQLNAE